MDIFAALSQLGFNTKESQVYLCLADTGKATAQVVSRKCRLPRTTAYFVLQNLAMRGVVVEERRKGTTYFSAEKPGVLLRLIKAEQQLVAAKLKVAVDLEQLLLPFFKSKLFSVPTLQFFEGKTKVESMLYEYLPEWHSSMLEQDNIWWGYQDSDFVVEYLKFLEHYWQMKDKSQRIHLFSNNSQVEKKLHVPNRIIRTVPAGRQFSSTFWVCGSYLIVIMHKNKPQYAFQIKDRILAANTKLIFELLWQGEKV